MRRIAELASSGAAQPSATVYILIVLGFGILVSLFRSILGPRRLRFGARTGSDASCRRPQEVWTLWNFRLILPVFPPNVSEGLTTLLLVLVLGNILYVGFVTISQRKLDLMLGYASVMHMGYLFLGLLTWKTLGLAGAALMLVAHGLSIAALFALSGELREDRNPRFRRARRACQSDAHLRAARFCDHGRGRPAWVCQFCGRADDLLRRVFSRCPGQGGLQRVSNCGRGGGLGVVISAVFLLRSYRRIFMGPIGDKWKTLPDIATLSPDLHRRAYLPARPDRLLPADRPELRDARFDVAMI